MSMTLAEAKKLFSVPQYVLRNGRLFAVGEKRQVQFWNGTKRIRPPLFVNEAAAQSWLDCYRLYAEVVE